MRMPDLHCCHFSFYIDGHVWSSICFHQVTFCIASTVVLHALMNELTTRKSTDCHLFALEHSWIQFVFINGNITNMKHPFRALVWFPWLYRTHWTVNSWRQSIQFTLKLCPMWAYLNLNLNLCNSTTTVSILFVHNHEIKRRNDERQRNVLEHLSINNIKIQGKGHT
jgi:hypothetical protein